ELGHLLRVRDLARRDLGEIGVRHLRERDLEDVDLLALDQSQEKLQGPFEDRCADREAARRRFHSTRNFNRYRRASSSSSWARATAFAVTPPLIIRASSRSEERRVGKEWRCRPRRPH